jgi:PAS domain S-box-containing protein
MPDRKRPNSANRFAGLARALTGERNYRALFELCPDALVVHDGAAIVVANKAMIDLVRARSAEDLVGRSPMSFVAPRSQTMIEARCQERQNGRRDFPLIVQAWIRLDGTEVDVEVSASSMPWVGPRAVMVMARDVTERRRLEAEREALLAEKELLLQEVHHRVANSLQLVKSLLNLQARSSANEEVRLQLTEASARIGTIGTLHTRLQKGQSAVEGEVGPYIESLMADLRSSLSGSDRRPITLESAEGVPQTLNADLLVPLGLIATEAVTNSLKHGQGRIRVLLARREANLELAIEDDGPGFPTGFDPAKDGQGLGMRMIATLAQARGGRITVGAGLDTADAPPSRIAATLPL